MTKTNEGGEARKSWFRIWAVTAAASGAAAVIVGAVLARNYFDIHASKPLESPRLDELKGSIPTTAEANAQEKLQAEARELDLALRRHYFRGLALADRGRYLLLGCLAVFVISLAAAASCRQQLPMPGKSTAEVQAPGRLHALARWSVAAVGVAMFACAIALVALTAGEVTKESLAAGRGLEPKDQAGAGGQTTEIEPEPIGTPLDEHPEMMTGATQGSTTMAATYPSAEEIGKNWPRFRGPGGSGISAYADAPDSWDGKTGKGILWKSKEAMLPGESSAVVWGKRVFLTGATKTKREVYCLDADSGAMLWRRPVQTAAGAKLPRPEVLEDTGFAASTAATDGQRVFAIFPNGDVVALDFDGNAVWSRNVGPIASTYGYGTSLCTWRNLLIVSLDQGTLADLSKSKLLALNAATGRRVWQTARQVPSSWATPIVIQTPKGEQIITCANPWVIAYEPATGKEIWRVQCLVGDVAPSPVFAGGLVFVAMEGAELAAIRPDGAGDVTKTHIAWTAEDNLPELVSPSSDGNCVWLLSSPGMLTCYDAKNGEKLYEQDLEKGFKSSPSMVGDRVYVTTEDGTTIIFQAGREYKELGRCVLGEHCSASPAFADGRIYLRGKKSLFCIGRK